MNKAKIAITAVLLLFLSSFAHSQSGELEGPGYYFPEGSVGYDTVLPLDRVYCVTGTTDDGEEIECPKDTAFLSHNGLKLDFGGAELNLQRDIPEDGGWFVELGNTVLNTVPFIDEPVPTTPEGNQVFEYSIENTGFFVNGNPPVNSRISTDEVEWSITPLLKFYKHKDAHFPPFEETPLKLKHDEDKVGSVGPVSTFTAAEGPYLGVTAEEEPLVATAFSKFPTVEASDFPSEMYQFEILQPTDHLISTENPDKGKIVFVDYNPADNIIDLFGADQIVKDLFGWTPVGKALNADLNEKTMLTGYRLTGEGFNYSEDYTVRESGNSLRPSKNFNEGLQNPFKYQSEGGNCIPGNDENCNLAMSDFTALSASYENVPSHAYLSAPCRGSCSLADKGYRAGEAVGGDGKSFKPAHSVVLGWQYAETSGLNLCPRDLTGTTQEIYGGSSNENCQMRNEVVLEGQPPLTKPPVDGSSSWGTPKFHVCFEGMESMDGKMVYSPNTNPDKNPQNPPFDQFKCDSSQGEWESVSTCDDGIDNDGNGKVDLEDPKCSSIDDMERDVEFTCPDSIVGVVNQDLNGDGVISDAENQKAAFWGYSPNGPYVNVNDGPYQGCQYNNIQLNPGVSNSEALENPNKQGLVLPSVNSVDVDDTDGKGHLLSKMYYCGDDKVESHPILTEYTDITENIDPSKISYDNIVKKYKESVQSECRDVEFKDGWEDSSAMPMASVQVPEKLIPLTGEGQDDGSQYVSPEYGYKPFKIESLREAEQSKFSTVLNDQPLNTEPRLEDRGINQTIASIYPSSSSASKEGVEEAWRVGNVLGFYLDSIDSISLYNEEGLPKAPKDVRVFEGGFAPKCPSGEKWTKRGNEWKCGNDFYHYVLPDLKSEPAQKEQEVALSVPLRSISDIATQKSPYEQAELTCWDGGEEDRPEDPNVDEVIGTTNIQAPSVDNMMHISGDYLEGPEAYEGGTFTCNTTLIKDSGMEETVDIDNWVNLWDAKDSEILQDDKVTGYIGSISLEYNLDYETCSALYGVPCDLFTNISTREDKLGEDWLSKSNGVTSSYTISQFESKSESVTDELMDLLDRKIL